MACIDPESMTARIGRMVGDGLGMTDIYGAFPVAKERSVRVIASKWRKKLGLDRRKGGGPAYWPVEMSTAAYFEVEASERGCNSKVLGSCVLDMLAQDGHLLDAVLDGKWPRRT